LRPATKLAAADVAAQGHAVHVRHLPVAEHDAARLGVEDGERLGAGLRHAHVIARITDERYELLAHQFVVVDDQYRARYEIRGQRLDDGRVFFQ
jgi:hypothetical protein